MKENKIDKAFKEGLKGGKMPYSENFWADMESLLPPTTAPVPVAKVTAGLGTRLAAWFIGISVVGISVAYLWIKKSSNGEEFPTSVIEIQNEVAPLATPALNSNEPKPAAQNETSTNEQIQNSTLQLPSKPAVSHEKNTEIAAQNNHSTIDAKTETISQVANTNGKNTSPASESITSSNNHGETTSVSESENDLLPAEPIIAEATETILTNGAGDIGNHTGNTTQTENATRENENTTDASTPIASANQRDKTAAAWGDNSQNKEDKTQANVILPHQKGKKLLWGAGFDYQYLLINRPLSNLNANAADYVNFRSTYENPLNQSSIGAYVQLEIDKWLIHTGIYRTTIQEQINYPTTLLVDAGVDNGQWQINEWWNYTIDSTWVIDSIFVGHWRLDTAWSITYDSLWNPQWDTVTVEKEMPELALNNRIFNLSYVEIPLWFGRSFGKNNWHFDAQAGVSFGLLTGTKGSVYINRNVDGPVTASEQFEQFNQLNISGMLRAGIRYEFSEQLQVLFYPTVRYNLHSVFKDSGIRQRYFGYGTSVGIVYRF